MKKVYLEQWRIFKQSYWKLFVSFFILFLGSGVIVYSALINHTALVESLMSQVYEMFAEKDLMDPDTTSLQLALGLFWNNSTACLLIFLSGFIPIFLPAIVIVILNGGILGVAFASLHLIGQSILTVLFAGILPHGIFEIPAIILAGALAFYISSGIFKKINSDTFSFKKVAKNATMTFVFVCVPLLIIAAIIEAFVTPLILDGFMM
ncbi:stage II sporulation protein M [Caldibacillus lycopersici]|uniref:Stage II sporulation protein M n=1 Tax=Perspicuibacillus lycopersici TaxID=1325689 RepID=A0AAE3IRI7_9BACI|nr:stage II sporulation protein M [Perspicuibacillus lycopersici]MCU9613268.1 stage II sporulation protein M [Perspicuibacillus lycopersici]